MRFYISIQSTLITKGWFRKKETLEITSLAINCQNGADFVAYNKDRKVNPNRVMSVTGPAGQLLMSKRDIGEGLAKFIKLNCPEQVCEIVYGGDPLQVAFLMNLLNSSTLKDKVIDIVNADAKLKLYAGILPDEEFALDSDYTLIIEKSEGSFSLEEKVKMIQSHPLYPVINRYNVMSIHQKHWGAWSVEKLYNFVYGYLADRTKNYFNGNIEKVNYTGYELQQEGKTEEGISQ